MSPQESTTSDKTTGDKAFGSTIADVDALDIIAANSGNAGAVKPTTAKPTSNSVYELTYGAHGGFSPNIAWSVSNTGDTDLLTQIDLQSIRGLNNLPKSRCSSIVSTNGGAVQ